MEDPKLEVLAVDDIPDNSFLIIRVDVPGPMEKYMAANELAKVLGPYHDLFKRKNVSIMIMTPQEKFDIMTEEELNQAGWVRKT